MNEAFVAEKNARALWLADKLVGDYGSEAAQLLRWFASAPSHEAPTLSAPGPHGFDSKNCPTFYDGCNCEPVVPSSIAPQEETPRTEALRYLCRTCIPSSSEAMETALNECADMERELRSGRRQAVAMMGLLAAEKRKVEELSAPSATVTPKYLLRSGGECPQDWLCQDIPEVQAALCEALYGRPEDADADDIGKYLSAIQEMPPEELRREWRFEDGWLEVIKIRRADGKADVNG